MTGALTNMTFAEAHKLITHNAPAPALGPRKILWLFISFCSADKVIKCLGNNLSRGDIV